MNGPESPGRGRVVRDMPVRPGARPRRGPLVLAYMASAPDGLDAHDDSFRSRSTRRAGRRSSRRLPRRAGSPPSGGSCATSVPERLSVPVANHAHARPRPLPFLPARHLRTFYCLQGDSRPGRGTPPHSRRETLGLVGPSVPGITGAAVRVARPAGCCEGSPRRLASMISASMTPGRTIAPPHAHGDMGMLPIRTSSARSRIGGGTGRGSSRRPRMTMLSPQAKGSSPVGGNSTRPSARLTAMTITPVRRPMSASRRVWPFERAAGLDRNVVHLDRQAASAG